MNKIVHILIGIFAFSMLGCTPEGKTTAELGTPEGLSAHPSEPAASEDLVQAPQEQLASFSVSGYTKGGKKQWDLRGRSADIRLNEIKLVDVLGKLYGKDMQMTIVADEGSLNRSNNSVHLEKNVRATSDDGAVLMADYLDWDAQQESLSSESQVWIKKGRMQAEGWGLLAQPMFSLVQLKREVTVKINPEEEGKVISPGQDRSSPPTTPAVSDTAPSTVITCDGPLEVDYQNNLAIFNKNVVVTDERGKIFAERMEVYFTTQTEEGQSTADMAGMGIEKVVATGDKVEIHHGGNITYSQKAVYDTRTGKLTLTGQPKLVIYSPESLAELMDTDTPGEDAQEKEAEQAQR